MASRSTSTPCPPLTLRVRKPWRPHTSAASRAITAGGCRVIAQVRSTSAVPPQSFHSGVPMLAACSSQAALSIMPFARRFSGTPAKARFTAAGEAMSTPPSRGIRMSSKLALSEFGDTPDQVALSVPSAKPFAPLSPSSTSKAKLPSFSTALAQMISRR